MLESASEAAADRLRATGSGRLSACLKQLGLQLIILVSMLLSFALTKALRLGKLTCGISFVKRICGMCTCRPQHDCWPGESQAMAWIPPVVRSSEHPDGLSELPAALHNRVQRENSIFKFCAEVCRFCQDQRILFSCEAPANSFMWDMPSWGDFFENVPHLCTTVDQCMFEHASFAVLCLCITLAPFML